MNYEDMITENGYLQIDTLLRFKGDNTELFAFLYLAEKANCTVFFQNEDITIVPGEEIDMKKILLISFYNVLYNDSEIIKNYINGLCVLEGRR